MSALRLIPLFLAALVVLAVSPVQAGRGPLIAAASSLRFALEELAQDFQTQTGESVTLVFGASGNFSRQIRQGAPFQMFLSADETYVQDLVAAGLTRDAGRLYAYGRLALVVPAGSALRVDGDLADLRPALRDGRLQRFAIANPAHAPYGLRAREVLQHLDLWQDIQPRLVLGENVGQAAQFVFSGNAQGGLVAYALVLSPTVPADISYVLVPGDWHAPLGQRMVLLKDAGDVAVAFYAYLQTPAAVEIFARYGFSLPEGD